MVDPEYERVKETLRRLADASRLTQPDAISGAVFVVYCAEWFRREWTSTFLRWNDPAADLFPNVPYTSKQKLTKFGLEYWRRPLRESTYADEYLLTVALEGGFPVRILAEGARSWLKEYLRAIMRRAIGWRVDTLAEILAIADEERGCMRRSYRHDDFIALCSELVASLLELRKKAETESGGGIRNSAVLDAKHPGWRDELPIYVPAQDEALVAELLTGLLDEKMTGLAVEGVEARRFLVKREGEWRPALQLLADGEVPPAKLPGLSATTRARAVATGELAGHLAGEVALLEPPIGEQRRWRVRPSMRTARLLVGFPFASPVTTTLTAPDSVPFSWTWPRGEALRSDLLVFQPDEGSTPNEPLLRFIRAGSVSAPAKTLYALVPHDWTVEPSSEDAVTEIQTVPMLGCKLARLTAAACFSSSTNESDRFRVEPNCDEREHELELAPFVPNGFVLADGWELIASPAQPLIQEGRNQPRAPAAGELLVRRPGGHWAPLSGPLRDTGLFELSWRDPVAKIQIEKRRLALMPGEACIVGAMKDALSAEIRLLGLPGWSAALRQTGCAITATTGSSLSIRFTARPVYRLPMTLRPPTGPPLDVIVPLVGRDAVIALANGEIVSPGRTVDVGALRGAVAVSPRRAVLHLGAKGSRSGVKTIVDGELPLGILRSAIDETLATLPTQDDLAEIVFIGDCRLPTRISRYRDEQLRRDGAAVRWRPSSTSLGASPVARMVLDPRHEHALQPDGDDVWRLPEQCKGPCLVYLRDGVDVVSRPVPVALPGSPQIHAGNLVSALAMPDYAERQRAIVDTLAQLARGEAASDDLAWLLDAATHLNGLPASALDGLKHLASCAEAVVQLLLVASDVGDRSLVWALQNELPFLWLALPVRAWRSVINRQWCALTDALEGALGRERAIEEAVGWLRRVGGDLAVLEPAVATLFAVAGLPVEQTTYVPSLRDLTSTYIRDQHQRGGDAPNELAVRLASSGLRLPQEIVEKSHKDFAGIFAPVLLAASAQEKLKLDHELALIARRALREDPTYVSCAWPHLLSFYS